MGFYVVEGSPKPLWMPVDYTIAVPLYIGQLVYGGRAGGSGNTSLSGIAPLVAGAGYIDTTGKYVPFGVVSGLATRGGRTYSSTYLTEYDTSVNTQAELVARDTVGVEGMISKTDPIVAVQITRIMGTNTVLKGPICAGALGTAPTVVTVTTGSATGLTYIAATSGFTPMTLGCTTYCRTGANMGIYRIQSDASTTTRTMLIPFPYDIAIGDTFVSVNLKVGTSFFMLDSLAMYIDGNAALTTHNSCGNVWEIDLKEAGKETATFSFGGDHFCSARA